MKGPCSATRAPSEGAKTERFPLPRGSPGARKGPPKKFGKSEVATEVAASSSPFIFTMSRDHLGEGRKVPKKILCRSFCKEKTQTQTVHYVYKVR